MEIRKTTGVCTLIAAILLCGCGEKPQQTVVQKEKVKVETAIMQNRKVPQQGTFSGTIESKVRNNIAPQMQIRIKKIFVEVGDHVKAGQKLAEMDAVNLEQLKLRLENSKTDFERIDELYKVGGVSKAVWDGQKLSYEVSKSSYENLLENTVLRSPISGIVTKRNYDSGDLYSMAAPLYVVEQINPVKLVVNVSESLYVKVKKGMKVDISLDVYGDAIFSGVVKLVYPSVDPQTRTFPVEIKILNNNEKIRPGMFARATFNYGDEPRIMISDRAVLKQSGSADRYVYICKDSIANYHKVVLGQRIGTEFEVLEGLTEGDVVITTGLNRLDDGVEVEIVKK